MTATELADAFFQSIIGRDSDPQRGRKVFATAEASLNLRISIYEAALRGIKKELESSLAWHVARIDEFKRNLTDIDTVRANVAKRRGKIKAELESLAKLSPEEIHAMAVAMRKPKVKKTKKPPKRKRAKP